jgi:hypothetical protein
MSTLRGEAQRLDDDLRGLTVGRTGSGDETRFDGRHSTPVGAAFVARYTFVAIRV